MDKKNKLLILTVIGYGKIIDIVDDISLLWQYTFRGVLNGNQKGIAEGIFHDLSLRKR